MFNKMKNGFTLAEVLITLVIIGVVAALTIPTAINKMQREELRSQFKKAVSVTSQVIQKMKIDYGDMIYDKENESALDFRNKFIKYFSVSCIDNCINDDIIRKYKNLSNSNFPTSKYFANGFITQDGSFYGFFKGENTKFLYLTVDINGVGKKPNRTGYDVYTFYISDSDLIPCKNRVPADNIRCLENDSSQANGYGCTASAISDANYFKNLH